MLDDDGEADLIEVCRVAMTGKWIGGGVCASCRKPASRYLVCNDCAKTQRTSINHDLGGWAGSEMRKRSPAPAQGAEWSQANAGLKLYQARQRAAKAAKG